MAWVAHRAALQAAVAYGQEARVVLDLHRGALLHHLGLEVPGGAGAERRVWDDLSQFYLRNLPLTAYVPAPAAHPPS
ncbi:hypothetical protein [Streptomyces sp. NPDC087270]|uniref:hypothetical protein n=1 Tax=Streptomyces sp. NPDC087270 TaxID=3365774 RepID=UPI00381A8233